MTDERPEDVPHPYEECAERHLETWGKPAPHCWCHRPADHPIHDLTNTEAA